MFVTWFVAKKRDYPCLPKASFTTMVNAFRESVWGLLLIVVVIGGIYTGIFTPTEAAAMSAVYAFIVAVFVYRDMTLKEVPRTLLAAANMSAMILYIITNAVLFSFLLTSEQIPQQLSAWISGMGLGSVGFLIMVNLLLLAAGNFMEPSSILLITAPLLFPMAMQLRHRSDPSGHFDDGEHGDRHDHAAGRPQPVRGVRHFPPGADRDHQGLRAVDSGDAGLSDRDHLCAGHFPVAAQSIV